MNTPQSVVQIPLQQIVIGSRLRAIDDDYVTMLAASMAESGQHTPVHVAPADEDGRHQLIAGAHRVAALAKLGREAVDAVVFRGSALEAQLLEIDENLMRRGLSELDRAVFLARRKEIYLELHPETGRGRASGKKDKMSLLPGMPTFARATAEKLGLSARSIDRAIARAKLEPEVRDLLASSRWADHATTLDALLQMTPDRRFSVAKALVRTDAPCRSVAEALIEIVGKPRTDAAAETERQYAALMSAWRKAGRLARSRFVDFLVVDGEIPGAKRDAA